MLSYIQSFRTGYYLKVVLVIAWNRPLSQGHLSRLTLSKKRRFFFNRTSQITGKNCKYILDVTELQLSNYTVASWLCVKHFLAMWEYGLIRKIMLLSEFMTSQPGWQTFTIHISNISWSKSNQTKKFNQLIEYNKRKGFLQKSCRKWFRETSSLFDLFLFFKKALFEISL